VDNSVEKLAECKAKHTPVASCKLPGNFLHIDLILINQCSAKNTVDVQGGIDSLQSLPQRSVANVHK
jgi:hypothetical protein